MTRTKLKITLPPDAALIRRFGRKMRAAGAVYDRRPVRRWRVATFPASRAALELADAIAASFPPHAVAVLLPPHRAALLGQPPILKFRSHEHTAQPSRCLDGLVDSDVLPAYTPRRFAYATLTPED